MIDIGTFDPVLAYCRERLNQCESIEAKAELASVIVLCEGLNRQQELIQKALSGIPPESTMEQAQSIIQKRLSKPIYPSFLDEALNSGDGSYKP